MEKQRKVLSPELKATGLSDRKNNFPERREKMNYQLPSKLISGEKGERSNLKGVRMYQIIDTIWGNSFDGSLCGIVIVENDMGERSAFIGSKRHVSSELGDAEYIARWGNKLTVSELMRLVSILEKKDE